MKKFILYIAFILFGVMAHAQDAEWQKAFEKTNAIYEKEHFKEAINNYLNLVQQVDNSPELYFNLANAYLKTESYTNAVYYYEKALKLNPNMNVAKTNLNFAKEHTKDDFTIIEEYDKSDIAHGFLSKLSVDNWAIMATIASILIFVLFMLYYKNNTSATKRILLSAILILFFIGIGSIYAASFESNYNSKGEEAIIFTSKIDLKSEARNTSETLKELHEGTKVFIIEHKALWLKVRLENQEIGWIQEKDVKNI